MSHVETGYLEPGQMLPLVIQPREQLRDLASWAAANREMLDAELHTHGAVLFRGFEVRSPMAFERVAASVCPSLFGDYGDLPRESSGGKTYGSTPYPADQTILFHNESSHMHRWPMRIFFFCAKAATSGGETPIVDCRKVLEMLPPSLRERFATKRLMYLRNYTRGLDVSWQDFFQTQDRSVVEISCRSAGIELEWKSDGGLRTRQLCDAVARHPRTGAMSFFNQIQLHHVACLDPEDRRALAMLFRDEDMPRNVYYGDGTPIEDDVVALIQEIYWKASVSFRWREGDVLVLDNMLTAHARKPYEGPRRIVVAMGDMFERQNQSSASPQGRPAAGAR